MRTIVRSIALMALVAGLVAGCGAATSSPTSTPASTQAPTLSPATSADPTGTPSLPATTRPSAGPMDAAYVTGSGAITTIAPGQTTVVDGISHVTGIELKGTATASDPRVSGTTSLHLTGLGAPSAAGGVGFEWGTMRIENAGGAWQGTVSGGVWEDANASDLAGWLAGSGAYQGLTYYIHVRGGTSADSVGVILPVPVPTP